MRLERLEIAGFKSFSDRSELAFDEGVTAIVGPNGCGKSNVADAITWVLGEQSAKSLRGEKMEDVIFGGSDARKPTAAAEVRLRLSGVTSAPETGLTNGHTNGHSNGHANGHGNGNGHANGHGLGEATAAEAVLAEFRPAGRDVELVRRLYRSGESEYLIDGAQCRLKDIHELLMDTGLGAKAYAIIEQGKIGLILSSRPTDRRQLIEEAAGITKYKARRRSAELKLEAAQQNLTRIDDIVFEVEKQRGSLKRQAAKARRFQRLRDELRRWEKVLFARKYRDLSQAIATAEARLAEAREQDAAAAGRVAEVESDISRLRIAVAEADSAATAARETTHARELDIQRTSQQVELNRQQMAALASRVAELDGEVASLAARRDPHARLVAERAEASRQAEVDRQQAADRLAALNDEYQIALREIEGLEGDVEASRSDVFAALNTATTLRHAIESAAAARERVLEATSRLDVEESDLRVESERLATERLAADRLVVDVQAELALTRERRAALDVQLSSARAAHALMAQQLRTREHDLAGLAGRLRSLEELEAARAGFTDAARVLLAEANGHIEQRGAVADYLEVDRRYERAVEALLGDVLQYVVVPSHAHAAAGVQLLREQEAGRCGFVVIGEAPTEVPLPAQPNAQAITDLVRVSGAGADVLRAVIARGYVAETWDDAVAVACATGADVATIEGELVRGAHLIVGGGRPDARGILATKGEIKELRARVESERDALTALTADVAAAAALATETQHAIESAGAELHQLEKALVGHEAQVTRAREEATRLERKGELLTTDRRRADDEIARLEAREREAREAIAEVEARRVVADERFQSAQRRLAEARGRVEGLAAHVAEAKASHAGLVERAAALVAELGRLEDAAREMTERLESLGVERAQKTARSVELDTATTEAVARLDEAVRGLDELRAEVRTAEDHASSLKAEADRHDALAREARAALDAVRHAATEFEIARATATSDLTHLEAAALETVQASLVDLLAEVEQLERDGEATPDTRALSVDDGIDEPAEGDEGVPAAEATAAEPSVPYAITAEEAIAGLRGKIDKLGPVNMMAIEQFDELEARHTFLTTQRKDLIDSIAATNAAIEKIDETSKVRFREAFEAINRNFQETFSTLFGGGHAGITLLDDQDPLESGIDIVASPPGKRLQNVQLLSGGEKALTAISLMFAIFKYKPSPFCLLDEIDAPLDDANIGRFVEMLKGMLHHTQFILITHNRKTMEIADRLYGVTMEEPGVSKLISVRLN
jgi:chromosome segregation protein